MTTLPTEPQPLPDVNQNLLQIKILPGFEPGWLRLKLPWKRAAASSAEPGHPTLRGNPSLVSRKLPVRLTPYTVWLINYPISNKYSAGCATKAQWIRVRLASCRPGFESLAIYAIIIYSQIIYLCIKKYATQSNIFYALACLQAQYRRILSCRCMADAPSPRFGHPMQANKKPGQNNLNNLNNRATGGLLHQRQAQSCRIPMAMTR